MDRTDFLSTLRPVDGCPSKATRAAQRLMRIKGYPEAAALGVYLDGDLYFYYYRLPEGVLEVEVTLTDEGRWSRRVTDFITNKSEVADMLGQQHVDDTPDSDLPMFRSPVD